MSKLIDEKEFFRPTRSNGQGQANVMAQRQKEGSRGGPRASCEREEGYPAFEGFSVRCRTLALKE
jgi:hypothetical protein